MLKASTVDFRHGTRAQSVDSKRHTGFSGDTEGRVDIIHPVLLSRAAAVALQAESQVVVWLKGSDEVGSVAADI